MTERLDREAVARILERAQEIEAGESGDDGGVDPATLVEAAAEVGIDPNAVRDSLAMERFSAMTLSRGRLDRLAGPSTVVIERELSVTVPAAVAGIEAWLTSAHRMICDRRSVSVLRARPRTDSTARLGRRITEHRGDGRLTGLGWLDVEAVALVVGSTPTLPRTMVRVTLERSGQRQVRLGAGGAAGVAGVSAGLGVVVVGGALSVVPLVSLPLIGGGVLLARSGRGQSERLELAVERMLSRVGRGESPTGLVGRVARRARRRTA